MVEQKQTIDSLVKKVKEARLERGLTQKDLAKLLTLLADAYIYSRLLTKAMDILKEIDKISPGLMSTYLRLIRIESVIGEDDSFKDTKEEK